MERIKYALLLVVILAFGWIVLFQGTQPGQASPLLGITMTPTPDKPKPTLTPVAPTNTPVPPTKTPDAPPTLPPPPSQSQTPDAPPIIPVTGTDKTGGTETVVNIGLVVLAVGLIGAGLSLRKPKK